MQYVVANIHGKTRRAKLYGREHLVVPLTMIVPGVLNGSKGSLFYSAQEIAKSPARWNSIPIVVYHPQVNGEHVSARNPDVLNSQGIGTVFRTRADAVKGGNLIAEGWFDVENTRNADSRILDSLEGGQAIELSTGLFTTNDPAPEGATFKGKPYSFVATNYMPDHLAVLPDQVGACSVADGCGVGVNEDIENYQPSQPRDSAGRFGSGGGGGGGAIGGKGTAKAHGKAEEGSGKKAEKPLSKQQKDLEKATAKTEALKAKLAEVTKRREGNNKKLAELKEERTKIDKELAEVQTKTPGVEKQKKEIAGLKKKIAALPPEGKHNVKIPRDKKRLNIDQADAALEQMGYKAGKRQTALIKGEFETMREITYPNGKKATLSTEQISGIVYKGAVQNQTTNAIRRNVMTENERNELVDNLIADDCCWDEDDREVLNEFTDEKLTAMTAEAEKAKQAEAVVNAASKGFKEGDRAKLPELVANAAKKPKAVKPKAGDEEEDEEEEEEGKSKVPPQFQKNQSTEAWMESAPPEVKSAVQNAMDIENREKAEIIGRMVANLDSKDKQRVGETLNSKPLNELRDLALLAPAKVEQVERTPSYLGASTPTENTISNFDEDDVLPLPVLNWEKETA